MIRAVIFDLDGTLLDTVEDIADAVNAVLAEEGFPTHSVETYKVMVGSGVQNLVERALPRHHRDEGMVVKCIEKIRTHYRKHGRAKTRAYDGIKELLEELVNKKIKLAVLSNKPHDSTVDSMEHFLGDFRFEVIEGAKADDPVKPHPEVALRIAQEMGVEPTECIFLGDTDIDMQTARAAGMHPVGALWGFRSGDELVAHGAEKLIARPLDLIELL